MGYVMVRLTIAVTILSIIALFTGFALSTGEAQAADVAKRRVTFQLDVLPILAKHCQGCHRPGQIAPMSFLTYETTRPWAPQIKVLVAARKMRPEPDDLRTIGFEFARGARNSSKLSLPVG